MYRKVPLVLSEAYMSKVLDNPTWIANSRTMIKTVNEVFQPEITALGCGLLSPRDIVRVAHMTRSNPLPFDMVDAAYRYLILYSSSETRDLYNHFLSWMRKHNQLHVLQLNYTERVNYGLVEQTFAKVLEVVRERKVITW